MADVLIIYSGDKQAAAGRLKDAIGSAGYSVALERVGEAQRLPEILDEARSAAAALLIWSRPLVSAALHQPVLTKIRRQKNLIEVSADGLTPSLEGDDSRVALISGWRGQPFHPGWQRILGEIESRCGAAAAAPVDSARRSKRPVAPSPAKSVAPVEPEPAVTDAGPTRRKRRFTPVAVAALGFLALAAGAATWIGTEGFGNGPSRPEAATAPPAPATPTASATAGGPARGGPPAEISASAPTGPEATLAEPNLASDTASAAAPADPIKQAVVGSAHKSSAAGKSSPKSARQKRPPAKRYSRRNSETMRLFCERSGRGTPQCRTYQRSGPATPPRTVGPAP